MHTGRIHADRGLTIRIVETWLLLFLVTTAYGVLVGLVVYWLVGWPWWVGLAAPVVIAATLYLAVGDSGVLPKRLAVIDAAGDDQRLLDIMARLCAQADTDLPRMKIVEVAWPNALAFRLPGRAPTVAVTRGLLDSTDEAQLEAVLAHELAHILHRDASVMTVASFLGLSVMLAVLAGLLLPLAAVDGVLCWLARQCGFSWRELDRDEADDLPAARTLPTGTKALLGATVVVVLAAARTALFIVLVALALVICLPVLLLSLPGAIVTVRFHRHRELAADRTAAMLTTRPAVLAATLTTLDDEAYAFPAEDLRELKKLSAMTIVPLPDAEPVNDNGRLWRGLDRALRTHPPVQHRLDQLAALTRELGRPLG